MQKMKTIGGLVCIALLVATLTPTQTQAQVLYGQLVGTVTDATGAVIPGADITATHEGSGAVRTAISSATGAFDFPTLQPGFWDVHVNMPGFKEFELTGVEVTLNNITRIVAKLDVGEVTEIVTVTSETSLLQTDRAEVRAEIPVKVIEDMPVPSGRNYQGLFGTLPGISTPTNAHSVPTNPSRALRFTVNGTSQSTNDIRIDGASQYDIWLPHITVYIPSLEAIETVNVVTNSFDAEQGMAGGAAVNVQIKSGTNEIHGSAFWYNQNNGLMAKPFFHPQGERNPKYIQNQWGGTVGGPIVKDKLFFFTSFEATPQRSFATTLRDIPPMQWRSGDFSPGELGDALIFDPATGDPDGTGRLPFPDNVIPADRINPVSQKILDLMPPPTFDGISNNFFVGGSWIWDRETLDGKIDWRATDNFNMWGRFAILDYNMIAPTLWGDSMIGRAIAGGNSKFGSGGTYSTTIAGSYVFSPTFVVDANFAWTRKDTASEQVDLDQNIGRDVLGIPGTNGTRQFEGSWPRIRIDGFEDVGIPHNFMPYYRRDPQYQYAGSGNWTKNQHNVRFGVEIINQHMNQTQPEFPGANFPASGGFRFRGGVTTCNGQYLGEDCAGSSDENSVAAFLLGEAQQMGRILQVDEEYNTRMKFFGLYVRDRWQITPKLTFSIGTRYEYQPMPTRADRGLERYLFDSNQMLVCGFGSVPEDCGVEVSKANFGPRLGFAYRATDTFVIRAGYGLTVDPFSVARPHRTNYPMLFPVNFNGDTSRTAVGNFTDGIPPTDLPDLGDGTIDVPSEIAVNSVPQKIDRGYVQSWNLFLQKELGVGFVAEAGYVATRSVRQLGYRDLNAGQVLGAGNEGRPYFAPYGRTTRTAMFTPIGHSTYDALQASLNRRFANGIQVNMNYTWSISMGIAGVSSSDNLAEIQALDYYHLNRALNDNHSPHRFNVSTITELPFGPGKRWATDGAGAAILGGWQFNTILRAQSGFPFDIEASGDSLDLPGSQQRADQIKDDPQILGGIEQYFDVSAFAEVNEARFGTAGFNSLLGPGQFNIDIGLFRTFTISEDVALQFRMESFNFTNTPHFNNPRSNISSSDPGRITGTRNTGREGLDQRIFRFGLRLTF